MSPEFAGPLQGHRHLEGRGKVKEKALDLGGIGFAVGCGKGKGMYKCNKQGLQPTVFLINHNPNYFLFESVCKVTAWAKAFGNRRR